MPKRSKRSTRSSLSSRPDQKQAGQERPQDDTYPPLQAADSPFSEEFLLKYLDQLLNDDDRAEIQRLPPIYYRVTEHMRTRKDEFKTADLAERDHFEATVKQQGLQCFFDLLRKAVNTGKKDDLMAVFTYSGFWAPSSLPSREVNKPVKVDSTRSDSQRGAIERSWTADFVGNSVALLERHVRGQMTTAGTSARYSMVIQSSGMGKSRLLDEFAKDHFLIPINLRPEGGQGFPPPDTDVRNFLTTVKRSYDDPYEASISRARCFLKALFCATIATVDAFEEVYRPSIKGGTSTTASCIRKFWAFMSEGQSFHSSAPQRSKFYQMVVKMATEGMANDHPSNKDLLDTFEELRDRINSQRVSKGKYPQGDQVLPDVFIMFDEAHSLMEPFTTTDTRCHFFALRRVLQTLYEVPMFTFFLSTNGKISQFAPPRHFDASYRMNERKLDTPRPFILLGFDQLMKSRKIFDRYKTLGDVTSLDCIAHMGRPLWGTIYDHGNDDVRRNLVFFAFGKLLCGSSPKNLTSAQTYAVLSHRLVLDTTGTSHIMFPDHPFTEIEREREQISNHMRVCVSIGDGVEIIRGSSPSEPILSEAASRIMRDSSFKLADALAEVLNRYNINPGDRAELLVSAFFTWARDRAVSAKPHEAFRGQLSRYFSVPDLFKFLFSNSTFTLMLASVPSLCSTNTTRQTFGQVFEETFMHFTHFIKPQSRKSLARAYLPLLMARGAAALGANCQPGVDAIYPYLYGSIDLNSKNVGFIIVQVISDVSLESQDKIFKRMDPFTCGLLHDSDCVDGNFPIPIIRIVFALCPGQSVPLGVTRKTYTSPPQGSSYLNDGGHSKFTSYDFWCSGVGPDIIEPVKEEPKRWRALVEKVDPWKTFYDGTLDGDMLRSQFPACGDKHSHFDNWAAQIPGLQLE